MNTDKIKAAIIGSTGYGGVELIRLLAQHPWVQVTAVLSSSQAGKPLRDVYPHLHGILELTLQEIDPVMLREQVDVVFMAAPAGVSSEWAPKFLAAGIRVIDLAGDYRLQDRATYTQWYKREAAPAQTLKQAVYGMCELFGDDVKDAKLVANPGCYPTATSLGLAPLLAAKVIDPKSIIIDAKSGVSGAGRGLSLGTHYAEINENFLAYKVNKHQHIPEIEQTLSRIAGELVTVSFTTHLVPMTRGILSTMYANLTETISEREVRLIYQEYYQGRSFIRVRPEGEFPATKEVAGSNYCDLGCAVDERTGRVTVVSVIDNVVKGAAGQAIQNLNLMMGWDEATGLGLLPIYP